MRIRKISNPEILLGIICLVAFAGFGLNLYSHVMLPSSGIDMIVAAKYALYEHRLWNLAIIETIALVGLAVFRSQDD